MLKGRLQCQLPHSCFALLVDRRALAQEPTLSGGSQYECGGGLHYRITSTVSLRLRVSVSVRQCSGLLQRSRMNCSSQAAR